MFLMTYPVLKFLFKKNMFLYDRDLHHEKVECILNKVNVVHLNINSLRNKSEFLVEMVRGNFNILLMSENKLEESFPMKRFKINGFDTPFGLDPEAVARRCSIKKVFLEISQNSQENICATVSFLIKLQASACNFIKKKTLAQAFSCEFCEISKNTFFTERLRWLLLLIMISMVAAFCSLLGKLSQ